MYVVCDVSGSEVKLKSEGCAPVSEVLMFFCFMSNFVLVRIYPAVAWSGCSPSAQVSLIRSYADFLLIL